MSVDTRKAVALVAILALAGRPVSRAEVAALLWPESEHTRARGALRRTLSALGSALDGKGLVVEGDTLAIDRDKVAVDVDDFRDLAHSWDVESLRRAAELYRGDFLAGFGLRDSAEFDEWQLGAAQDLRADLASVLERLVNALASTDVDEAISYSRRWVELEPLREEAHRRLIRLHTEKGDRSSAVLQYRECVKLLERELGVGPTEETTKLYEAVHAATHDGSGAAGLHELMGDLLTLQGRYREALGSFERASDLGSSVLHKLADVHQRMGDYDAAERFYVESLAVLSPGERGQRARVLADRSLNALRREMTEEAERLAAQALEEAEAAGDDQALAQTHNISGMLATHRGDLGAARTHLEASVELSEKMSDPVATAAALNNMALALRGTEIERALQLAQRALDLCARVGDRHKEAAMHSNLADLLRAAGRDDEALGHLRLSAAIFADVGEPDELHPEIWKLTEW